MLGTSTNVNRRILYQFDDEKMSDVIKATLHETVDLSIYVKQEIGASATATTDLNLIGRYQVPASIVTYLNRHLYYLAVVFFFQILVLRTSR